MSSKKAITERIAAVIATATVFVAGYRVTGDVKEQDYAYVSPIGESK